MNQTYVFLYSPVFMSESLTSLEQIQGGDSHFSFCVYCVNQSNVSGCGKNLDVRTLIVLSLKASCTVPHYHPVYMYVVIHKKLL